MKKNVNVMSIAILFFAILSCVYIFLFHFEYLIDTVSFFLRVFFSITNPIVVLLIILLIIGLYIQRKKKECLLMHSKKTENEQVVNKIQSNFGISNVIISTGLFSFAFLFFAVFFLKLINTLNGWVFIESYIAFLWIPVFFAALVSIPTSLLIIIFSGKTRNSLFKIFTKRKVIFIFIIAIIYAFMVVGLAVKKESDHRLDLTQAR